MSERKTFTLSLGAFLLVSVVSASLLDRPPIGLRAGTHDRISVTNQSKGVRWQANLVAITEVTWGPLGQSRLHVRLSYLRPSPRIINVWHRLSAGGNIRSSVIWTTELVSFVAGGGIVSNQETKMFYTALLRAENQISSRCFFVICVCTREEYSMLWRKSSVIRDSI